MLEQDIPEMIDICSQCEGFLKNETTLLAVLITTIIGAIIRKFEKKKIQNDKN